MTEHELLDKLGVPKIYAGKELSLKERIDMAMSFTQRKFRAAKVGVTYGRTVNLGDYNSAKAEYNVWAEVDIDASDADIADMNELLWGMAKENVRAQVEHLKAKTEPKEYFLGLPVVDEGEE